MTATRSFRPTPESVPEARRFAVDQVRDLAPRLVDAVALAVSELATNCVRYAGTDFTVGINRADTRLRVEVRDGGGGTPTMRAPTPNEATGRGLLVVDAVADDWGVEIARGQPGKCVWFEMQLSDAALQNAG